MLAYSLGYETDTVCRTKQSPNVVEEILLFEALVYLGPSRASFPESVLSDRCSRPFI
jgi:hypothetical protein